MENTTSQNEIKNTCSFYVVFQVLKLELLELHSSLTERNIFFQNFAFLMDSLKPSTPLTAKIC